MMSQLPEPFVQAIALATHLLRRRTAQTTECTTWDTPGIAAAIRGFAASDDPATVAVAFIAAAERPEIRTPKGTPLPGPVAGFEPPAATPTPRAPRCEHHPDTRLIGGICHDCTNFTPAPRPADFAERVEASRAAHQFTPQEDQ